MNKLFLIAVVISLPLISCSTTSNKMYSNKDSEIKEKNPIENKAEMLRLEIEKAYRRNDLNNLYDYSEQLSKILPNDVEALDNMAYVLCVKKDFINAIPLYDKILKIQPDRIETIQNKWDALYNIAKSKGVDEVNKVKSQILNDAIEIQKNIDQYKNKDEFLFYSFYELNEIGMKDDAMPFRKQLISDYPNSKFTKYLAQIAFEEEILASSRDINVRVKNAEIFVSEFKKTDQSDSCYRMLINYYSGLYDDKNKDITKADKFITQWIKDDPSNEDALYIASITYARMNFKLEKALELAKVLGKLVMVDSSKEQPYYYYEVKCNKFVRPFQVDALLGKLSIKLGQLKDAENYLNAAIKKEPEYANSYKYYGELFEKLNDNKKSIEMYLEAGKRDVLSQNTIKQLNKLSLLEYGDENHWKKLKNIAANKENILFEDITEKAGLTNATGGRIAFGDYNNDGLQDILLDGCKLWVNKGKSFEDVTTNAGIFGNYTGGLWADYNNDGLIDFLSTGTYDALWKNNGDGTFDNVAVVIGNISDGYPTEGAAWADYNNDGFVDFYMANYEQRGQRASGTPDALWMNIKGKEFRPAIKQQGIAYLQDYCGRGVSWADYNNDGFIDLLVSNYRLNPNFLWQNSKDFVFTNAASNNIVEGTKVNGYYGHTIGSSWCDYDNDGDWDLIQCNLAHPRFIEFSDMTYLLENQLNNGELRFENKRKEMGIKYEETHSDPTWGDFDNDGFSDLFITSIYEGRYSFLYHNLKGKKFNDISWLSNLRIENGWGAAAADIDNDGDLDLLICSGGKPKLFENISPINNNWLEFKLVGEDCNKSAIGAIVYVMYDGKRLMRDVSGGKGTTTQNQLPVHFGIGSYNGEVEVEILWPCGRKQSLKTLPNKFITVNEVIE